MIQAINPNTQTPTVQLPNKDRNYTLFDQNRVNYFVSQKEQALPYLKNILQTSQDEKQIVEALYIVDRMLDNGVKGIPAMYPVFARFNDAKSPNIQSFLAGIYRKTQVPDAFGPLVAMLIKNSTQIQRCKDAKMQSSSSELPSPYASMPLFDPNEEIGGAILEYIRNYGLRAEAVGQNDVFVRNAVYREQPSNSNNPKKIDYSA